MNFKELRRWFLFIIILVVAVRAIFFFVVVPYNPVAQSRDIYLEIARNVVAGQGFSGGEKVQPTATRGPIPVYFFALVLWLFGDHTLSIALANWIVEAVTCLLLYPIAFDLFHSKPIAVITSLLFAFYGPGMNYSWQALSEPLFTMLLAAFVLGFLQALRSPSTLRFVIAGILLGLASLTRPIIQYYLLIAIAVLVWILYTHRWTMIKWAIALTASFIIMMTPWTIRNYLLFGEFIPVSSLFGFPFYQSNHALGEPDFLRPRSSAEARESLNRLLQLRFGPAYEELTQPQYDRAAKEEAIKIIRQSPGRYLVLSTVRFFRLWYFVYGASVHGTSSPIVSYLVLIQHGLLFLLAAIAWFYYRDKWWQRSVPLFTLLLYYVAGYTVIHVDVRFIVPVMPYVMLFVAVTIASFLLHLGPIWPDKLASGRLKV